MDKKIKDPIYGYVKIPVEYMEEIIDKAEFQRLRSIAAADTTKDNMFYIFYRRKNHNHIKDKKEFCKSLVVKTIDT